MSAHAVARTEVAGRRFLQEKRGSVAIESALAIVALHVAFAILMEIASMSSAADRMDRAARAAAQTLAFLDTGEAGAQDLSPLDRQRVVTQLVHGLKDLAMSLIRSDRYGTPLSQSMKNIAAAERLQRAARITAQAERLPVLMTLPMLLFVVPGTMLFVAGPAFLSAVKALGGLGG